MSDGSLTTEQAEIVSAVREFVDKDVIPVASELEHADEFPTALVETMKQAREHPLADEAAVAELTDFLEHQSKAVG